MPEKSSRNVASYVSGKKSDHARVTDVNYEIAKDAYWDLAVRETGGVIDISRSADMSVAIATLEKMLDELHKQPYGDLIFVDPISSEGFVPPKPHELRFRESFRCWLPKFVELTSKLPKECKFSPALEVFAESCRKFFVSEYLDVIDGNRVRDKRFHKSKIDRLNRFYWYLKNALDNPLVRRKNSDLVQEIKNNTREFLSYIDGLFKAYSRLVVVRVDLEYREEFKPTLAEAINDLGRLFKNNRNNKIFSDLRGYVVKIEYGVCTGYHFHTLMFFDGSKRANHTDVYIGEQLTNYWNTTITKGRGRAHNVNRDKSKYAKVGCLGIGTVHAIDTLRINNLKNIVRYFCKKEQYCRPHGEPKFKTIRKGLKPSWVGAKPGRPRKKGG
ncbi:inovirus-type Gp2 protein [Azonexus sp. IMCC34842]|uniref:YagK/YfjJ domain-containing protein n=1 Tax=Azonexus sp. IMCC34842 TaxID=3420950 RepID=UPI003D12A43E